MKFSPLWTAASRPLARVAGAVTLSTTTIRNSKDWPPCRRGAGRTRQNEARRRADMRGWRPGAGAVDPRLPEIGAQLPAAKAWPRPSHGAVSFLPGPKATRTLLRATERRISFFSSGVLTTGDGRTFWLQPDAATRRRGPRGRRHAAVGSCFRGSARNELRALGIGDKWCASLSVLPGFREYSPRIYDYRASNPAGRP